MGNTVTVKKGEIEHKHHHFIDVVWFFYIYIILFTPTQTTGQKIGILKLIIWKMSLILICLIKNTVKHEYYEIILQFKVTLLYKKI